MWYLGYIEPCPELDSGLVQHPAPLKLMKVKDAGFRNKFGMTYIWPLFRML